MMSFFFFNDTATTEIYTLSLHDALPIWPGAAQDAAAAEEALRPMRAALEPATVPQAPASLSLVDRFPRILEDRKSTRLNSSHANISYAVFCLKKKKPLELLPHQPTAIDT